MRLKQIDAFHGLTPKRRALRVAMQASTMCMVDRWILKSVREPLMEAFPLSGWLEQVMPAFGPFRDASVAVSWPSQHDRGRLYVHLFDAAGSPAGFAKLSLDALNDSCLGAEAATLRRMKELELREAHVPFLLDEGNYLGRRYIVLEPVPPEARALPGRMSSYPKWAVEEYAGPPVTASRAEVKASNWWQRCAQTLGLDHPFLRRLDEYIVDGLAVRQVHGDLTHMNMLVCQNRLWILDWEHSVAHGPALVDLLSFYLSVERKAIAAQPERSLAVLQRRLATTHSSRSPVELAAALAFLHGHAISGATSLLQAWDKRS